MLEYLPKVIPGCCIRVRPDRKRQDVWSQPPDLLHIIIGFEKKSDQLHYVTAIARKDNEAKRVACREIRPIEAAPLAGDLTINNFNSQWELPAEEREPQTLLVARGRDPEFLTAYSLRRIAGACARRPGRKLRGRGQIIKAAD